MSRNSTSRRSRLCLYRRIGHTVSVWSCVPQSLVSTAVLMDCLDASVHNAMPGQAVTDLDHHTVRTRDPRRVLCHHIGGTPSLRTGWCSRSHLARQLDKQCTVSHR